MEQYVRPTLNLGLLSFTVCLTVFTTILFRLVPALRVSPIEADSYRVARARRPQVSDAFVSKSTVHGTERSCRDLAGGRGSSDSKPAPPPKHQHKFSSRPPAHYTSKLPSIGYLDIARRSAFFDSLIDRIDAIPDVVKVSGATC